MENKKGEIIIYMADDGQANIEVKLQNETVWLTQKQIAEVFGTQRPAITKHLINIFKSQELDENSVCSILEHTAEDKKNYDTKYYNLDAIISVGYRVNSIRATQFRIWANRILKNYLLQGFAINQELLAEQKNKLRELSEIISFINEKKMVGELSDQAGELIEIINSYTHSLDILRKYDEGGLELKGEKKAGYQLTYTDCHQFIKEIAHRLEEKYEATNLFGQERGEQFQGILGALYQTFGGEDLYSSLEEKAANLLYLVIKDHPFSDGNKRIGSLLFIYFLEKNNFLWNDDGKRKIADNTLAALSLLVATSNPKEKDVMIKIVTNLL